MPGVMKMERSWRNMIGQRRYELSVINWGKFSKACLFRFLCVYGDKDAPLFRYREGTSHMRCYDLLQRKTRKIIPVHVVSQIPAA